MTDHFPSAQKGRNRLIGILLITGLPVLACLGVMLFYGIVLFEVYVLLPFVILGFLIWTTVRLFQGNRWARGAWFLGCLLIALLFLVSSIGVATSLKTTNFWIAIILFSVVTLYAVLGFSLYQNYHIDAYFHSKQEEGLMDKIENIGKNEPPHLPPDSSV